MFLWRFGVVGKGCLPLDSEVRKRALSMNLPNAWGSIAGGGDCRYDDVGGKAEAEAGPIHLQDVADDC